MSSVVVRGPRARRGRAVLPEVVDKTAHVALDGAAVALVYQPSPANAMTL